jgi:hypothetical protein
LKQLTVANRYWLSTEQPPAPTKLGRALQCRPILKK